MGIPKSSDIFLLKRETRAMIHGDDKFDEFSDRAAGGPQQGKWRWIQLARDLR
jgi:hypothetical protein